MFGSCIFPLSPISSSSVASFLADAGGPTAGCESSSISLFLFFFFFFFSFPCSSFGARLPGHLLRLVLRLFEDRVQLLRHAHKRRPLAQLLQLPRAHVRARRPDASKYIADGGFHGSPVGDHDGLPFASPILRHPACVSVHGGGAAHAVEFFVAAAVGPENQLAPALVVPRQHAPQHHEVGPSPEGLRHVARARAAAVGDDEAAQAVGGVRALDDGGQLRVADARQLPRGADAAGADPNLHHVGAAQNQLLRHLTYATDTPGRGGHRHTGAGRPQTHRGGEATDTRVNSAKRPRMS
eukprot:GHVT01101375.1.p1 GENE.GHVT01101375.1~~GHVT01101375.1.p1  ORF type:complete len:296 (-),score=60.02 GHVT01101375.1:845-1732(-)